LATKTANLLWKSFKGIRKLNAINSDVELGADKILNVSLAKEKSGQARSIRSSGWHNEYLKLDETVIRLFAANMSGYRFPNQLIAFTKTTSNINAWLIEDDSGILETPVKIGSFVLAEDVTDVCMTQFGDRLIVVLAFGNNSLGYLMYSADNVDGWIPISSGSLWKSRTEVIYAATEKPVGTITQVVPFGARLAINGGTRYVEGGTEYLNGVWLSEAGNPLAFTASYASEATETSAFFAETGEYVNKLVEYNGLTAFCRNRSYNIRGSSQNDYVCQQLTARGVFGNAAFVLNGECAYIDSYSNNILLLSNQLDGTIGVDQTIGNDIQDYLTDVEDVSLNVYGRRVRLLKSSGESLVYDVDISEWTVEKYNKNSRAVTFLNKELFCDATDTVWQITTDRTANSVQTKTSEGFYSYYKTNLIWLDSQTSVKSHIIPLAVILEPQTNNDFYVRFTTDRKEVHLAHITKAGFANLATYSENDEVADDDSMFVETDGDLSGRVFASASGIDLLVTIDRPPYWRYLQIEIYTDQPTMEFNISGIEAKQTFITDELLDY
jgi:hypothetical protein